MGGFCNRVDNCSDFSCNTLFGCLVKQIFLVEKEKYELIFLDREGFDFL